MSRLTARRPVLHIDADGSRRVQDTLAAEEPLELRVDGRALSVTMRTPGHDVELAHGFLLTEDVIGDPSDVLTARYCDSVDDTGRNTYNVLDVTLAPGVAKPDVGVERNFYTTSSCGVCGKAALDAVRLSTAVPAGHRPGAGDARHAVRPARLAARRPADLRRHRRAARGGAVHGRRRAAGRAGGRRAAQRRGQGARLGAARRSGARWRAPC